MAFGSAGRSHARLGAWLPDHSAILRLRTVATVALAVVMIACTTPSVFAQETNDSDPTGGTVRVRSVDTSDDVASTDDGEDVAPVAMRDTPVAAYEAAAPSAGDLIVGFALQYVGYPYVWAGNSPAGFDCSGFTQYVILNTLGIDIGHGLEGQPGAGMWVDAGSLMPGDLIFFQNTYQAGLSHVGIYIGDGLFVHAENEGTGVVVSAVWSDYYGSRYWGAVRIG